MDFTNWNSSASKSGTASSNYDLSSLLMPSTHNSSNAIIYPSPVSSSSKSSLALSSASLLSGGNDDDFVEFNDPLPNNTAADFDFDFTPGKKAPVPMSNTPSQPTHQFSPFTLSPVSYSPTPNQSSASSTNSLNSLYGSPSMLQPQPSPSYNPFGASPSSLSTTSASPSSPSSSYNPFGPNTASSPSQQQSFNANLMLTPTSPSSALLTPTGAKPIDQPLLGAKPLAVDASPLGSLGDLLDKDERGELDRKSNYFQTMSTFSQPTPTASQPTSTNNSKLEPQRSNSMSVHSNASKPGPSSISHNNASLVGDSPSSSATSSGKPKAIEIEWIAENSFLCIVDQCKVEKSILSKQVSFRISTKVVASHPHLNNQFFQVRRSISDFEHLHKHLAQSNQFLVMPPLPHKSLSSELVSQYDQYCKNYQSFLIRLGRHPHFSKLVEVADFLMKTPEEYAELKKVKHEYPFIYAPLTAGWFSGKPSLKDEKLVNIYKQVCEYKEMLKTLKTTAETIRKNYAELSNSYLAFTEELKKIPIGPLIKPESGANVASSFTTNFDNFAHSFSLQSDRMATQTRINENLFDQRVEIWIQYSSAAIEAVDRFAALEAAWKEAQKSTERRTERVTTFRVGLAKKTATAADEQKMKELTTSLEQAETTLKSLDTLYSTTKNSLFNELKLYDQYKCNEMNAWMEFVGECEFTHVMQSVKVWNFFAPK